METPQAVVPKPTGGTLTQATTSLCKCKSISVDRIIKVGMFEQVLYEEVTSMLPECFIEIDVISGRTLLPCLLRPRLADLVLVETMVRDISVDGIEVKV